MAGVVGRGVGWGVGGVGELVAVQNGVIVNTTKCRFYLFLIFFLNLTVLLLVITC